MAHMLDTLRLEGPLRLWVVAPPGLEAVLADEMAALGLRGGQAVTGGVELEASAAQLLHLQTHSAVATRVWLRLARFPARQLSELARRAKAVAWERVLAPGAGARVRAVCSKSRVYHSGAAAERVAAAVPAGDDLQVLARLDNDVCTLSADASGEALYVRGHKQALAKAPLRDNVAAAFLRLSGWTPQQPLFDPMCGSGTFVLEAASRAAGLAPGRDRAFACERWPLCAAVARPVLPPPVPPVHGLFAADRDAGAVQATRDNARRSGVDAWVRVAVSPLSRLTRPDGPPGWLVCNPPYGRRIGDRRHLRDLYAALGNLVHGPFAGWSLALVTPHAHLAEATGLSFQRVSEAVPHGGLRVRLFCYAPA